MTSTGSVSVNSTRSPSQESNSVRVTAGETLAILMHAARTNRAWLTDFADETISISKDMYDVLLSYKEIALEEHRRVA